MIEMWPKFMTKVKDMLDTVSRLKVRPISADLHIFTFTSQSISLYLENLPMSNSIVRRLVHVPSTAYCL